MITTSTPYWPFGLPLETGAQPREYRFGFQGQLKDNEWTGTEGSHLNYKYRVHDARIGRFLSVDPLTAQYPHNSPYAFSENRVINSGELEGLEAVVKIYEQGSKTAIRTIDYTQTKLGHGPLGHGYLTINKFKDGGVSLHYSDPYDKDNSFHSVIDKKDFVEPPAVINDNGKYKFTSKIKFGVYAEQGVSFSGIKVNLSGGVFQELCVSEFSENGKEGRALWGETKGYLEFGPLKLESDPIANEVSLEVGGLFAVDKITYKGNENKFERTSTANGEEDISIFTAKSGFILGAEFDLIKTNPIKFSETKRWHDFLKTVSAKND